MSNILKFPSKYSAQHNSVKDSFHDKLKSLHLECIEDIQKSEEYITATGKKLFLRELLITKYKVEEEIIDELLEITSDLIDLEYDYVNCRIPELFLDSEDKKST